MQRELRHYTERQKAAADRHGLQREVHKPPRKPRGGSSLLAALNGQIVRGGSGGGSSGDAGSAAPLPLQCAFPLRELPSGAGVAAPAGSDQHESGQHHRQQHQHCEQPGDGRQEREPPQAQPRAGTAAAAQPCPLCGALLPPGHELEAHVEAELLALEAAEAEEERWEAGGRTGSGSWAAPPPAGRQRQQQHSWAQQQGGQQQHQQHQHGERHEQLAQPGEQHRPPRQQPPRQAAAPVLVLGGRPAVTAPTDRRGLQRLQRQRLLPAKRRPAVSAFNFFDDGSGVLGGEDIGLEGAPGGMKWEGMGTSDF
ncbi:hypothetical protein ABPG75_011910 [Micractinium tetrahymenae]